MAVSGASVGGSNLSDPIDGGGAGGAGGGLLEADATLTTIGTTAATSRGTTVLAGNPANSKGSYVEIISSTAADTQAITLCLANMGGTGQLLVDIATGAAASEVDVISNIYVSNNTDADDPFVITLPITIAAGTRIAVRSQGEFANGSADVTMILHGGTTGSDTTTVLNADTATTKPGTDLAVTVANTKGVYQELIASTAEEYKYLVAVITTTATFSNKLIDIATGAAASETVFYADVPINNGGSAEVTQVYTIPKTIPLGTRIAARFQSSSIAAKARVQVIGIAAAAV